MNVSGEPVLNEERQPIFNAPWPSVTATLVIIVGYFFQTLFPQDWVFRNFAFSSAALEAGRDQRAHERHSVHPPYQASDDSQAFTWASRALR